MRFIVLLSFLILSCSSDQKTLVVCTGNSLMAGDEVSNIPELVDVELPSKFQVINKAIGQQTTTEMIKNFDSLINPISVSVSDGIMIVWEGRNDMVLNNLSPLEAYYNLKQYCLKGKSAGFKIIILTTLPSWYFPYQEDSTINGYQNLEKNRLLLNSLLVNNHDFADYLIDVGKNKNLGCSKCNENAGYKFSPFRPTSNEYFKDGTHLNQNGNRIVAQDIVHAIQHLSVK